MSNSSFTVTAALPYANGPLHLGHVSGVYLPADIFVRYLRMNHQDVLFLCGSDEHGAAITLRAKKDKTSPQEIVDKYNQQISSSFTDFGISFDVFHRTSSSLHHQTARDFFKKLWDDNRFIEKTSEQYYDNDFNQFLADRYITGSCPKCNHDSAYGDQCENCGAVLSPLDLISPKSTLSGKVPVLKKTTHWYLPLDQHEKWLKDWVKDGILDGKKHHNPQEWRNQVVGQCLSWIEGGLRPRAMTRDLDWGVKVPIENAEGKVLYVWLDAPIGYISATKHWAEKEGKDWKKYWCKKEAGDRKLVHFIGKDNIVFHTIIFPILLKDHGEFILPDNVPSSEFLNLEGNKFSTSRNWAVWLHDFLERYPDKVDELRYVLTAIAPESKDADFTWKEFQLRINSELCGILGNFINRAVVLIHKYFDGIAPVRNEILSDDDKVLEELYKYPKIISEKIKAYKIREAQQEVINVARLGNKYLAEQEPWKVIKVDKKRVETIMSISLEITSVLGVVLMPFLPESAKKIQTILGVKSDSWFLNDDWRIKSQTTIGKPYILFSKIEDSMVEEEVGRLELNSL